MWVSDLSLFFNFVEVPPLEHPTVTKHSAVIRISERAFIVVEWRGVRKTRGVIFPAGLVGDYQFVTILQHLCQYRDEFVTKSRFGFGFLAAFLV